MSDRTQVRRALLSVWDKRGIVELAERLSAAGVELVSSGGTSATLRAAGITVTDVADVTGFAEMLGGRVKTLHPSIHAGILADRGLDEHHADLESSGIDPIDLVVADFYPFEEAAARAGTTEREAIETIDIGGPAMVRAAAKNHAWVGVVTSPDRYEEVAAAIEAGGLEDGLRRRLASEAFARTAEYDAAIVGWMQRDDPLPKHLVLAYERDRSLRYGENPSQVAALYRTRRTLGWWHRAVQHQGKEMSFNNYADAEASWRLVNDLVEPAAVVVKHTNPCGVAVRAGTDAALRAAWDCDPLSAFGGVVAVNRSLDRAAATELMERFVEVVVAPEVSTGARDLLATRRNLRILEAPRPHDGDLDMRRLEDGLLVQERSTLGDDSTWDVVTERTPGEAETAWLRLAWTVAAHTKSNAVVIVDDLAAVGIGAGDQSRVGAAERAVVKAGARARGAVAASDGFFPFPDGLEVLALAGVGAVVQPGGSRRDDEVIAAADEHGLALVFTHERKFTH